MKKNNNKSGIWTLLLTLFIFALSSCETDDGLNYDLDIPNDYQEAGKIHNDGLEYILKCYTNEIIKSRESDEFTHLKSSKVVDFHSICTQATMAFATKNKTTKKHIKLIEKYSSLKNENIRLKSTTVKEFDGELAILHNQIIEASHKRYSQDSIFVLRDVLNEINKEATEILSDEEAKLIYAETSIAYSSYQYWIKNYKKWYFILNYPEMLSVLTEKELNNVKEKSVWVGPGNPITALDATLEYLWNETEGTINDASNAIEGWWDTVSDFYSDAEDDIYDVVSSDIMGFCDGCVNYGSGEPISTEIIGAINSVCCSGEAAYNMY